MLARSEIIKFFKNSKSSGFVRSKVITGPDVLSELRSIATALMPILRMVAVKRPDPEKISMHNKFSKAILWLCLIVSVSNTSAACSVWWSAGCTIGFDLTDPTVLSDETEFELHCDTCWLLHASMLEPLHKESCTFESPFGDLSSSDTRPSFRGLVNSTSSTCQSFPSLPPFAFLHCW